jgi:hypothetical protein
MSLSILALIGALTLPAPAAIVIPTDFARAVTAAVQQHQHGTTPAPATEQQETAATSPADAAPAAPAEGSQPAAEGEAPRSQHNMPMMCPHGKHGARAGAQAPAGGCCKDGKCAGCAGQAPNAAAKEMNGAPAQMNGAAAQMSGAANEMSCACCGKDAKCA